MIKKYRKKPVVIEAKQFNSFDDGHEINKWIYDRPGKPKILIMDMSKEASICHGDWVTKTDDDIFQFVKGEEFQATYEEVKDE